MSLWSLAYWCTSVVAQAGVALYTCREAEAASLGLDTSKQTKDALSVHAPLAVAAWKGKGSINILVSKGNALPPKHCDLLCLAVPERQQVQLHHDLHLYKLV